MAAPRAGQWATTRADRLGIRWAAAWDVEKVYSRASSRAVHWGGPLAAPRAARWGGPSGFDLDAPRAASRAASLGGPLAAPRAARWGGPSGFDLDAPRAAERVAQWAVVTGVYWAESWAAERVVPLAGSRGRHLVETSAVRLDSRGGGVVELLLKIQTPESRHHHPLESRRLGSGQPKVGPAPTMPARSRRRSRASSLSRR